MAAFNPFIDASPAAKSIMERRYPQRRVTNGLLKQQDRADRNYNLYSRYKEALAEDKTLTLSTFARAIIEEDDYQELSRSSVIRVVGLMQKKEIEAQN